MLTTLSLLVNCSPLCLAALYEAGRSPPARCWAVVPLGILGTDAFRLDTLRGMERDVYFRVAMLTHGRARARMRS